MQSQGSTSSQPSFDSMSSSDSLLLSDSEQAEEDTDVFLTDSSPSVIIGRGSSVPTGSGGSESPGSLWTDYGYTDKEEEEEPERSERASGGQLREGGVEGASQRPKSQGDLVFAQKCAELQGFVKPLLELLNGLKRGRFERGLSGFQQSVAMDRIQRIVGVLQRPNCGEKYLSTLLQVEMMLKLWFPQISTSTGPAASNSPPKQPPSTPPHKHKDQSHIPVKKRRLSWTGTESPSPPPVPVKQPHTSAEDKTEKKGREGEHPPTPLLSDSFQNPQEAARDHQPHEEPKGKDTESEERSLSNYKTGQSSNWVHSLTWVHIAPILSLPTASPPHKGAATACNMKNGLAAGIPIPTSRGSPATQDSSVTSTTPHKHPKKDKPIRCQSQPAAGQQTESSSLETCHRQGPSPPVTVTPLSRCCPAPLEA